MRTRPSRRSGGLLALAAAGAASVPAQQPLTAKSFLPDDYRNVMFVDLAALRANGVWDELEASLLKIVFQQLEKESGIALRAVDRVTMVADPGQASPVSRRAGDVKQLVVVEGNAALALPGPALDAEQVEIGGHAARSRRDELYVLPRAELYVAGHDAWLRTVLEGKPSRGVPAADVMSLLAGRSEQLAYFVFDVTSPLLRQNLIASAFPDTQWTDGEGPTFICVRLLLAGSEDDPALRVEAVVRHAKDGGAAVTAKAVDGLRARLAALPQLRTVGPVLAAMVVRIDHADVVCTLDLGRVRTAIGHVASLGSLLFAGQIRAQAAADAVPAERVAPGAPAAGEKKR